MVLRGLLGKMLVIAGSIGLMVFAATEWLIYQWENAPTHYPDGRVLYPDGRLVHPDGRVEQHKQRILHADGRVEYRDWPGRRNSRRSVAQGQDESGKW